MINVISPTEFSVHRYGWAYAMSYLKNFQSDCGIMLDDFIEKTHSWNVNFSIPYKTPWVGFLHNPQNMPIWFDYQHSPESILKKQLFQESLKSCRAIFVLSNYLASWLKQRVTVPVFSLFHPTGPAKQLWSHTLYRNNPTIVQLGYWLRKLHRIYSIKTDAKKVWLPSNHKYANYLLDIECRIEKITIDKESVEVPLHLPNSEYDEMLSRSVAIIDVYESSANNALIECIVRNTPVIINKHPAVVEYLGKNYPLYCDFRDFSAEKLIDSSKILEANEYLSCLNKKYLTGPYFAKTFYENIQSVL